MITEDYCSFEISNLLKEKGFDESCWEKYDNEGCLSLNHVGYINSEKPCADFCALAPTLQMAMKWLRIEYNIHIEPHVVRTKCSYGYMPSYVDLKELKQHLPFDEFDFSNADKYVCITYDKACEAAIKYVLENLI